MSKTAIPFLCLSFLLMESFACDGQEQYKNCGVVISGSAYYVSSLKKYIKNDTYSPDTKVWYKDSIVIQERFSIDTRHAEDGTEKRQLVHRGFTFIDIATKSFYHYSNFSDTAKLRAKWTQPDSTPFNDYGGGVWNFYNPQSVKISEPPVPLSDTIIDGISYKRIKFMQESNGFILPQIGYFRCDKKGTMFQYFKTTSEKIGCPLTRFEGIPTEQVPRPSAAYILFISDMLTPDELKVFAAWEKNAKENPVLK